jgi:hypothetical protein
MENLYEQELEKLEASSLQITVLKSGFSNEVIAASPEYWEALEEFNEEYPAIAGLISEYEEHSEDRNEMVQNSLDRTLVYAASAALLGSAFAMPALAVVGIAGVGMLAVATFSSK